MLLPPNALDNDQLAILNALHKHFNNAEATIEGITRSQVGEPNSAQNRSFCGRSTGDTSLFAEDDYDSPGTAPNIQKKRGRPRTNFSSNESWGAARNLQTLKLATVLASHLSFNKDHDACLFLDTQAPSLPINSQALPDKSPMEVLVTQCLSVKKQQSQTIISHVRWLFMTLSVGDIGIAMFGTGAHLTDTKRDELKEVIARRCTTMQDQEKKDIGLLGIENLATRVSKYAQTLLALGERLAWLCDQFGTGCLFWLQDTLTEHL